VAVNKTTITAELQAKGFKEGSKLAEEFGAKVRTAGDHATGAARGFGDMAKGLGGFVGAYAGAAATFFALQQAFSALKESAKLEQSIQGTRTLAAAIGQNGDELLTSIQKITRGQLTLRDAAESTNLALSSGFNTDQIEKLSTIATKASKALGRDLGDSFVRLVRGTAKLEPELLDELGIFTRIEPAVQAYAAEVGKSEKFLTNFERRQAFANAVTEEGMRKFQGISSAANTSISSLERLTASLTNLGLLLTNLLAGTFAPFADFLSGSFANSLSAIGLIAGLAFSKLFQLLTHGLREANEGLDKFSAKWQDRAKRWSKTDPNIALSLQAAANNFDIKGSGIPSGAGVYAEALRKQGFSTADVKGLQTALESNRASTINAIQEQLSRSGRSGAGIISNLSQFKGMTNKEIKQVLDVDYGLSSATRGKGNNLQGSEADKIASLLKNNAGTAEMLAAIEKYNAAQSIATKGIDAWIGRFKSFGSTVINVFDKITAGFSRILFIISIIELGGSVLLKLFDANDAFDTMLKSATDFGAELLGLDKKAQDLKKTLGDIADVTLSGNFKSAGLSENTKFDFEKSIMGIGYTSPTDQADLQKKLYSSVKEAYDSTDTWKQTGVVGYKEDNFKKSLLETAQAFERDYIPQTFAAAEAQKAFIKSLTDLANSGPGAITVLRGLSSEFGVSAEQFKKSFNLSNFTQSNQNEVEYLNGIKILTDKGLKAQEEVLRRNNTSRQLYGSGKLGLFGGPGAGSVLNEKAFNSQRQELNDVNSLSKSTLAAKAFSDQIAEYLQTDNINSDGLAQMATGLDNIMKKAKQLGEKQYSPFIEQNFSGMLSASREQLRLRELHYKVLSLEVEKTQAQLALNTQLTKTFQAEINLAQEFSGQVGPNGSLAVDPQQVRANMLKNLDRVITVGGNPNASSTERRNRNTGLQVLQGLYIKTTQELKKMNEELDKQIIQSSEALFQSAGDLYKVRQQNEIKTAQQKLTALKSEYEYNVQLKDIAIQRVDIEAKAASQAVQFQINRLNEAKTLLEEQQKYRDAILKLRDAQADMSLLQRNRGLQVQSDIMDNFDGLFSSTTRTNVKLELQVSNIDKLIGAIDREVENTISASQTRDQQFVIETQIAEKQYQLAAIQGKAEQDKYQLEIEKIGLQQKLAQDEKSSRLEIFSRQENIARKDFELQTAKIESDKNLRDLELKLQKERIDLLKEESKVLNNHVEALAKLFASTVAQQELMSGGPSSQDTEAIWTRNAGNKAGLVKDLTAHFFNGINDGIKKISVDADSALSKVDTLLTQNSATAELQKQRAKEEFDSKMQEIAADKSEYTKSIARQEEIAKQNTTLLEKQKSISAAAVDDAYKTYEATLATIKQKRETNAADLDASIQKLAVDKERLEQEKARAQLIAKLSNDPWFKFANDFVKIVKDDMTKGLQDLNQAMLDGNLTLESFTQGLKDWARTLLQDIEKALFQRLVVEPLTNYIQDTLSQAVFTIFGLDLAKPGSSPGNPIYASIVPGPGGAAGSNGIGGLMGGIGDFFSNIFGSGTSPINPGFEVPSILESVSPFSSGGSVRRMANGGQFGRDIVPAMLEPDEYVLRSSAARSIGMNNLNRMNNHGAAGVVPNVNVNVQNNGTPQEVQGKPNVRFDGSKMVVDIVLKDFANNGPIRQTLRGDKF
jgi:hypothetical protein